MDLKNKNICIIGFGKSGQAAAKKMLEHGARVKVSESKSKEIFQTQKPDFDISSVEFEFGGHSIDFCSQSDLIVISPGVHLDIEPLEEAKKKNIPVISEIELAFMFFTKPVIAITGTNGKTTTTTLTGKILNDAGLRAAVGGNIGHPLILIDDSNLDFIVAEISSYQLEAIDTFRPHVAVLLNITEDHLERYKTMAQYAKAKARIFENQTTDDHIVFNYSDPLVMGAIASARSKKVPFSGREAVEGGFFIDNGFLVSLKENVIKSIIKTDDIKIKGAHNIENCLAAAAVASLCGVPNRDIEKTLMSFEGVEHRIEPVATINGVDFINDSKGTNPDSTIAALRAVSKGNDVILILGGRDKGTDLGVLCGEITKSSKAAVLIGEATARFKQALKSAGFSNIIDASTMDGAVKKSFDLAEKGDKILLSPACASFDMFDDFEHRGREFKESVRKLKNEIPNTKNKIS